MYEQHVTLTTKLDGAILRLGCATQPQQQPQFLTHNIILGKCFIGLVIIQSQLSDVTIWKIFF